MNNDIVLSFSEIDDREGKARCEYGYPNHRESIWFIYNKNEPFREILDKLVANAEHRGIIRAHD